MPIYSAYIYTKIGTFSLLLWMTSGQPQCDIIIEPYTDIRFPYFWTGQIHNNREKVPTFVYIIVNIQAPRPVNNNACG